MQTIVLVVAGILVVAGLALIVLSFIVAQPKSNRDESGESGPASSADEETPAEGAFIDEPLASDMAQVLEDRKKSSAGAQQAPEQVEPDSSQAATEDGGTSGTAEDPESADTGVAEGMDATPRDTSDPADATEPGDPAGEQANPEPAPGTTAEVGFLARMWAKLNPKPDDAGSRTEVKVTAQADASQAAEASVDTEEEAEAAEASTEEADVAEASTEEETDPNHKTDS